MLDHRSWYQVTVGDSIFPSVSAQVSAVLEEGLQEVVATGQQSVAVFETSSPWETGDFFFSPGAIRILANLIRRYDGRACARPSPAGLSLLFGPADAMRTMLGARDLPVQEQDRLERELRRVRREIQKLPADTPSLTELREEERRLESQFEEPDFSG